MIYWVRLNIGGKRQSAYCIEATDEAGVAAIVKTVLPDASILATSTLPYPAQPRLGPRSDIPSFCYSPNECAGKSCCPKNYACDD